MSANQRTVAYLTLVALLFAAAWWAGVAAGRILDSAAGL